MLKTWSRQDRVWRLPLLIFAVLFPLLIFVFSQKVTPESGSSVAVRPPGWVFGVAWSILILLIIGTWVGFVILNKKRPQTLGGSALFTLFILLCVSWMFLYANKGPVPASWMLWFLVLVSICLLVVVQRTSWAFGLTLAPVVVWVLFASVLNTLEAQHSLISTKN